MKIVVVALAVLAACDHRAHVTRCEDDLHGVWGAPDGARWMMLDDGGALEAYPMFDDAHAAAPAGVIIAPRVLDLARTTHLDGQVTRRFTLRGDTCESHAAVHVTRCADDTLELVLADPPAPLALAPCAWPQSPPARVERWRRD